MRLFYLIILEVIDLRVRSFVTDRYYDPMGMVYLMNPTQAAKYLKHGATIYDVQEREGTLVIVFSKRETCKLYQLWKEHKLE